MAKSETSKDNRLLSLDFFRGITMLLLIGEFSGFIDALIAPDLKGSFFYTIGMQLHHVHWEGLRFWDLIQPFFTFIMGVSMPFSFTKRMARGDSYNLLLKHAIKRSLLLLGLGWALYWRDDITFYFQDVLAQLSVAYLITFLVLRKKSSVQLIISFGLIIITEVIYRTFGLEGFNHPFTPNENFGTWLDLQYGGADLAYNWVSFNAIPTTAHTIWGAMTGYLLMSDKSAMQKVKILTIAGLAGLVAGYGLGFVTPIIKHIATSSFVIVSGGWSLLALAISYWIIDVKQKRKWVIVFAVVGMNPLFIYIFSHIGGGNLLLSATAPLIKALFAWIGEPGYILVQDSIIWFFLWYICYWMYTKKVFVRI